MYDITVFNEAGYIVTVRQSPILPIIVVVDGRRYRLATWHNFTWLEQRYLAFVPMAEAA